MTDAKPAPSAATNATLRAQVRAAVERAWAATVASGALPALPGDATAVEIEIARPVIALSPLLKDKDLVQLLLQATLDHQVEIAREHRERLLRKLVLLQRGLRVGHRSALNGARGGPRQFQRDEIFLAGRIAVDVVPRADRHRDLRLHRGIPLTGHLLGLAHRQIAATLSEE